MKASELIRKLVDIATDAKTLYVWGGFGAPATPANKKRYTSNYTQNAKRADKIASASDDTFFFDCVGLFKGVLWGWNGDKTKVYGGAVYQSNGVPDESIKAIASKCSNISTDFTKVEAGEFLWNDTYGHCGICVGYIDGKLYKVEATSGGTGDVQIFEIDKGNRFTHHGKSCYVEYDMPPQPAPEPTQPTVVLHSDKPIYSTAYNAVNHVNPAGTLKAGTYYVYKTYSVKSKNDATCITKTAGKLDGGWIATADLDDEYYTTQPGDTVAKVRALNPVDLIDGLKLEPGQKIQIK